MIVYRMRRTQEGARADLRFVPATGALPGSFWHELDPRRDLRNHSPDGFQWGYSGSGPAQLALALCASALDDDDLAEIVYQEFKAHVVATEDRDEWELTDEWIQGWVKCLITVTAELRHAARKGDSL